MIDYSAHYRDVEITVRALLAREDFFTVDDKTELEEFIASNEYGLALECLASIMLEHKEAIDLKNCLEIRQLSSVIGIFDSRDINAVIDLSWRRESRPAP